MNKQAMTTTTPTPAPISEEARNALRNLIDDVWQMATDSQEVPSVSWADELIDNWMSAVRSRNAVLDILTRRSQAQPVGQRVRPVIQMGKTAFEYIAVGVPVDRWNTPYTPKEADAWNMAGKEYVLVSALTPAPQTKEEL